MILCFRFTNAIQVDGIYLTYIVNTRKLYYAELIYLYVLELRGPLFPSLLQNVGLYKVRYTCA
jgi:hypothetical protein